MDKIGVLTLILIIAVSTAEILVDGDNQNHQQTFYDLNAIVRNGIITLQNSERLKNEPLDIRFRSIRDNLAEENIVNSLDNSTKCVRDIKYIAANLKSDWAKKMLDSFGKPGSGIIVGNVKMIGEYAECMDVYAPKMDTAELATGDFNGQHCALSMSVIVQIGICIPDSCTAEVQSLLQLLNPIVLPSNVSLEIQSDCKPRNKKLNGPAQAVIAILSFFGALVIMGSSITVVKYFLAIFSNPRKNSLIINIPHNEFEGDPNKNLDNKDDDLLFQHNPAPNKIKDNFKKIEPFFECFCLFKNGAKLLNTDVSEGELLCIHGIRFLSMSWVILGHTYLMPFLQTRNLSETIDGIRGFAFQIILQGFFSVDSFFVLSGFLLTYLCMQQLSKSKGGINWPYFYVHRYLRLTPVYMIVLGFSSTIYLYLGSGPFWPSNDLDPICRKTWWWNLLYINNFVKANEQCMAWSWYLANDMQFFVISPIILVLLWRWPKVGYSLLGLLLTASWVANFYITYHYDLMTGMAGMFNEVSTDMLKEMDRFNTYFIKLYNKPYTRITPYLAGMLLGYILFIRKRNNSPKHSWAFLFVGWIVATTITLATVYGLYHQHPSLVAVSFYNALSRTAWALGLCWVIYVCLIDQGGFINSLMSYKLFIPLSRLTYVAYLIHPMIIGGYFSSLKTSFEFSHPTMVLIFLGIMVSTYALSLPVALVLESPIIVLEKLIRKKLSKPQE